MQIHFTMFVALLLWLQWGLSQGVVRSVSPTEGTDIEGCGLLLVTVAALPMERGLKLFCLTMTIMIMICIQIAMKPFRNNALNFAETFFLITLNAIGLATSSEMPEKDVIQVGLVLLPALHVCLVSCWSRFYADSFGENGVPLRKQSYVELKKQEHTRRCAKAKIGKPGNDDEYVQL